MTRGKDRELDLPNGPFYGGHIIRTPDVLGFSPKVHSAQDPLLVFGGAPGTDISGGLPKSCGGTASTYSSIPQGRRNLPCSELCVICYPLVAWLGPHGLHACERHRLQ